MRGQGKDHYPRELKPDRSKMWLKYERCVRYFTFSIHQYPVKNSFQIGAKYLSRYMFLVNAALRKGLLSGASVPHPLLAGRARLLFWSGVVALLRLSLVFL